MACVAASNSSTLFHYVKATAATQLVGLTALQLLGVSACCVQIKFFRAHQGLVGPYQLDIFTVWNYG